MRVLKLIIFSLLQCIPFMLLGQTKEDWCYEILRVDKKSKLGEIILHPDGFFDYSNSYELMNVYQRGLYRKTDSTLVLIPIVPADSINVVNVSRIGLAEPGNIEVLFFDIFNNPLKVLISNNGTDWDDTASTIIISNSTPRIYIKSYNYEADYLRDVLLREKPYRWNSPILFSMENFTGEKIKVVLSEEVDWVEFAGRQWWTQFEEQICLRKKHSKKYVSTDQKIMLRCISCRGFY